MIHIVTPFFCAALKEAEIDKIVEKQSSLLAHCGRVQRGLHKSFSKKSCCIIVARRHSFTYGFTPERPLRADYRTMELVTTAGEPLTAIYDNARLMLVDRRRHTCYLPLATLFEML